MSASNNFHRLDRGLHTLLFNERLFENFFNKHVTRIFKMGSHGTDTPPREWQIDRGALVNFHELI